jgi:hypothetical protein
MRSTVAKGIAFGLMMALGALNQTAQACSCRGEWRVVWPTNGATDIPTDSRLLVEYPVGLGRDAVTLLDEAGVAVPLTHIDLQLDPTSQCSSRFRLLQAPDGLPAGQELSLTVEMGSFAEPERVRFHTTNAPDPRPDPVLTEHGLPCPESAD